MEYSSGKLNPGTKYAGEDFTGTYISEPYREYSLLRKQRTKESDAHYEKYLEKREQALASAPGTPVEEIAKSYSAIYQLTRQLLH